MSIDLEYIMWVSLKNKKESLPNSAKDVINEFKLQYKHMYGCDTRSEDDEFDEQEKRFLVPAQYNFST